MHTTLEERYDRALGRAQYVEAEEIFRECKESVCYDIKTENATFTGKELSFIIRMLGDIEDVSREVAKGRLGKLARYTGKQETIYDRLQKKVMFPFNWTRLHIYGFVELAWEGIDGYVKPDGIMPNIKIRKEGKYGKHNGRKERKKRRKRQNRY